MALLYPLEALRVRLQVRHQAQSAAALASALVAQEGLGTLYRGMRAALLSVGVSSGVYFYWYSLFKRVLTSKSSRGLSAGRNMLVAALAGIVNVLLTHPLWTLSTQLTLRADESILQCCQRILESHGLAGLYAGLASSIMLVSNPILQFVCYEQLAKRVRAKGAATVFCMGACAKALATLATYPLLVAKSKLQALDSTKSKLDTFSLLAAIYR